MFFAFFSFFCGSFVGAFVGSRGDVLLVVVFLLLVNFFAPTACWSIFLHLLELLTRQRKQKRFMTAAPPARPYLAPLRISSQPKLTTGPCGHGVHTTWFKVFDLPPRPLSTAFTFGTLSRLTLAKEKKRKHATIINTVQFCESFCCLFVSVLRANAKDK